MIAITCLDVWVALGCPAIKRRLSALLYIRILASFYMNDNALYLVPGPGVDLWKVGCDSVRKYKDPYDGNIYIKLVFIYSYKVVNTQA